jgi:hypothetical protein
MMHFAKQKHYMMHFAKQKHYMVHFALQNTGLRILARSAKNA